MGPTRGSKYFFTVTAPDQVKNSNTKRHAIAGGLLPLAMIHAILNITSNKKKPIVIMIFMITVNPIIILGRVLPTVPDQFLPGLIFVTNQVGPSSKK
jgi:hypothetical protein